MMADNGWDKLRAPLIVGETTAEMKERAGATVRWWTKKRGGDWPQSCDTILMSLGLKEKEEEE